MLPLLVHEFDICHISGNVFWLKNTGAFLPTLIGYGDGFTLLFCRGRQRNVFLLLEDNPRLIKDMHVCKTYVQSDCFSFFLL